LLDYLNRRVSREDVTDLLQETFVRALGYSGLQRFADPPAFLQKIAVNLTCDLRRRRKIDLRLVELGRASGDVPSGETSPEERIDFER